MVGPKYTQQLDEMPGQGVETHPGEVHKSDLKESIAKLA